MNKDKLPSVFETDTSDVLKSTIQNIIAGLAALVSSEKKQYGISIGKILQNIVVGKFLSSFKEEWDVYVKKGTIKKDYQGTEQHQSSLLELLDMLDKEVVDEIRFDALKKLFLVMASERYSTRDDVLPQQLLKICRKLESSEILIISGAYLISKDISNYSTNEYQFYGIERWRNFVASKVGLSASVLDYYENSLIEKKLISPPKNPDGSGVQLEPHFRLTRLGFDLCEFISRYDNLQEEINSK
jgi:hypothetical protein